MRLLILTNSPKFVEIDDCDLSKCIMYTWYLLENKSSYSIRRIQPPHMALANFILETDELVDHEDHNPFNCKRLNLRECTYQQNAYNAVKKVSRLGTFTSRYKGVSWKKDKNKWKAEIRADGRKTHIGYFDNEIDAAKAYDTAAIFYHEEFAGLNFPKRRN